MLRPLFFSFVLGRDARPPDAAEAVLQRDLKARVAIAVPELLKCLRRVRAIGREKQPVTRRVRGKHIVDAEAESGPWARAKFNECCHVGAEIEVRIELVGAIKREPLIVIELEPVGESTGVSANRQVPLPGRPVTRPLAALTADRIIGFGLLARRGELRAQAFPQPS